MPNDELLSLGNTLKPLITPVIVARELIWSTPEELEIKRMELRTVLEMWRLSLEESDLITYLALYSDGFRYRGMNKPTWSSYRQGAFDARQIKLVKLDDVLLIADPEEPGLYLSRFTQEYVTSDGTVRTTKRLYWMRQEDRTWRIVAEGAR